MELTDDLKGLLIETAKQLKGGDRRLFMARTVKALGPGGASRAEHELGWNRKTIRNVCGCLWFQRSQTSRRPPSQPAHPYPSHRRWAESTDPQFKTNRLYTRLTAPEVRRQLIEKFGYKDKELPTATTIGTKLNSMGYHPMKVTKSKPKKNSRPLMPSSSRSA